jgi:hypothetical protein
LYLGNELESQTSGIQVFPNPLSKNIYITLDNYKIGKYQIYDVTGRIIFESFSSEVSIAIDARRLNAGLYYFVRPNKTVKKFIVE